MRVHLFRYIYKHKLTFMESVIDSWHTSIHVCMYMLFIYVIYTYIQIISLSFAPQQGVHSKSHAALTGAMPILPISTSPSSSSLFITRIPLGAIFQKNFTYLVQFEPQAF